MHKVLDISGLGNRTYLPDGAPAEMLGPQTPEPSCSAAHSPRASSAGGTYHIEYLRRGATCLSESRIDDVKHALSTCRTSHVLNTQQL